MTTLDPQSRSRELLEQRLAAALAEPADIIPRRVDPSAPVPLSDAQSRLWFLDQLGTTGPAFHIRLALRLRGPVDEPALLGAVRDLARRHEVLRARVEERDGEFVSVVVSEDEVPVVTRDVEPQLLDAELAIESHQPFDLSTRPPMRAALLRSGGESVLSLTFHHVAVDGWSLGLIRAELPILYRARLGLGDAPPPAAQHTDYAAWSATHPVRPAAVDWWAERLAGLAPLLNLPTDRPRPAVAGPAGGDVAVTIPGPLADQVRTVAARTRCTPFMVLLAAWQALLSRICGTTDVAVGVVEAGRRRPGTDAMIGCFVNTVVVRTDLSGDPTGTELLARIREVALDAFAHADVPFEQVVARLRPDRSATSTPIVQTLFNFLSRDEEAPGFPGLDVTALIRPAPAAKSDLHLTLSDGPAGFVGSLNYRSDLFDEETVRDIASWYLNLLTGMLGDSHQPVGAVALAPTTGSVLRGEVRQRTARTIHPLVEQWADRTPDALAVVAPDGRLTYAELDHMANRIAHTLLAAGVRADEPVGVLLEHGVALPATLLGVLKAGAGYLPLDAMHPASRIAAILDTAGVRTVVTVRPLAGMVAGNSRRVVVLDDPAALDGSPAHRPNVPVHPHHLLHVIFTSGSTGTPKGVAVEHGSASDYLDGVLEHLGGEVRGATFAVMSTIAADFAHTCLHVGLTTGGTVHFVAREIAMDPVALGGYLAENPIDVIKLVPSHFELLASHGDLGAVLPRQLLLFAGEALPWSIVERARAARPGLRVQNHYGHTESTMVRTVCDVDDVPENLRTGIVPLGRPLANTFGFLVDREGRRVPPGVPGELLVGGPGVARGYVGAPALTAQRFVTVDGQRVYRSGDLLRVRWDGWVEFRGRVDDQVKVRGYRVEPGDVAEALRQLPGIAEAVVLPFGDGQRQEIAAWVVPVAGARLEVRQIRTGLREKLPEYLVPASLMVLDRLPLTPNGKVDRSALPRPEAGGEERVLPRTPTEHRLARVWAEILGLTEVGIDDDFFALGGDSFAAVRAVRACDPQLRVIDLFTRPTVRELAAHLDASGTDGTRLLHRLSGSTGTTASVICFPYGGGSAAVYQPLAAALPDNLAVLAVELPGHDPARPDEEFLSLDALVQRVAHEIDETVTGPIVVYGHSVGATAAVALARRLEAGGRSVLGVVVAGNFPATHLPGRVAAWVNRVLPLERMASNRHYRDILRTTGGLLDDMNEAATETALRAMRHDAAEAREWFGRELAASPARLAAPILCVVGEADHATELYQERYREWGAFADQVGLATIPRAGHYFVRHQAVALASILKEQVTEWAAGRMPGPVERVAVRPAGLRAFYTVAGGQFMSMLGYTLGMFALGVWAYQRSGRVFDLGLVTMLATLPAVLVTPLGGTLADRVDRRRIMLVADTASGVAMAVLALLLATGRLTLVSVCVIVAATSIASAFHRPAYLAATAQLVPKPYLPQANALVGLATGFGTAVGPLLGGTLIAFADVSGVVYVGVGLFAVGVGSLLAVRFPDQLFPRQRESFGKALTGGFHFIIRRKPLLLMIGFAAVLNLFAAVMFVAVQPLVLSFAGVTQLGWVTTVGGLGAAAGGLLMLPWGGTRRRTTGMIGAALGVGAGTVLMGVHASVAVVALGLAVRMGAMAVLNAHWLSIIQVKVGQQLQGRVLATNLMLALATQPIGFLAAGPLADDGLTPLLHRVPALGAVLGEGPGRGMALLMIICGLCIVVWSALGLCWRPLRRLEDDLPDATPEPEILPELDAVQRQADQRFAAARRAA
ncbi:amino acid adenylation domain-containing protein [Micromonospora sp. NPDC050417]|uniref:amino acid adenylation domain-containing protein n=1 Tax=Micromonospora sp. NPDC050417 TaxID=3364280 RepID=UPI0037B0F34D